MKKHLLLISSIALAFTASAQVPTYVPTSGLVSWWSFSGNANDGTTNNNNGTNYGATLVSDRFSVANRAYSFDGVHDSIVVADSPTLQFSSHAQSFSFWLKIPSLPNPVNEQAIFEKMDQHLAIDLSGASAQGFRIDFLPSGDIAYAIRSGISSSWGVCTIPHSNFATNQYFHIVFTNDGNTMTGYCNGISISSTTIPLGTAIGSNSFPLLIGKERWTSGGSSMDLYNGIIDDIGVWDRALTQTEVTQIYSSTQTSCTPDISTGLVAKFDFTGNANDLSTNGNNAIVNGATLTADRFGNANCAYSFNGTSDYIEIPNITAYNNQLYTISFWAKTSAPASSGSGGFDVNPGIISKLSPSTTVTYDNWVFYEGNGTPGFACYATSGLGGPVFNDNTWHNIVTTVNTDSVRFYLDGALSGKVVRGPNLTFNTEPIRIGRSIATYWKAYAGLIDELRIFNRAISSCDVDSLYNSPNPTTVGIADMTSASEFTIAPNPFSLSTTLTFTQEQTNSSVKVIDVLGKEVKAFVFSGKQVVLDKGELTPGIYFVQTMKGNKNTSNKKIIIQ